MEGKLYLVGTPIGNLEDISKRALDTLESVDYILAEDTRVTMKILNKFNINKNLTSYYKDIENKEKNKIIEDLKKGKNIALVTDAGMPTISDPGAVLVNEAVKNEISITTIPGPTAASTAFASSGFLDNKYIFYGFMKKYSEINEILLNRYPTIIYESPNRIKKTLEEIKKLDPNRKLFLGRELTKMHETLYYGTADEILKELKEKGEFVLVIDKSKEIDLNKEGVSYLDVYEYYLSKGYKKKEIIKLIARDFNKKKNEIYDEFIDR